MSHIVSFYRGEATDSEGRRLAGRPRIRPTRIRESSLAPPIEHMRDARVSRLRLLVSPVDAVSCSREVLHAGRRTHSTSDVPSHRHTD